MKGGGGFMRADVENQMTTGNVDSKCKRKGRTLAQMPRIMTR